jgi:predicted solute-binding protein
MVFAVWAARAGVPREGLEEAFTKSYRFGREHMEEIIQTESSRRELPEELVRDYLMTHVRFELGERESKGMKLFLKLARNLDEAARGVAV